MRQHGLDIGKLFAVWGAWLWAVNWNNVAGFFSAVFTLLLIMEKVGLLNPLKTWGDRAWQRVKCRWAGQ